MKFRVKDLKNYLELNLDWQKIAEILTAKAFESSFDGEFLDVDILANRYPDASSFIGLAQEICALVKGKIKYPSLKLKEADKKIENFVKVERQTNKAPFYFGRVILNIKNDKSPEWLKELVESYGLNSINFLVDLSNLVMLEYGAPLHIFDLDKIKDRKIIIREAKKGEKFTTLGNTLLELQGGEIVIADKEKILALAGIIGSKDAEVDFNTKNIFIESAVFDAPTIYRTSRNLKLITSASYRFERKVIPYRSLQALESLASLIQKNLGGEILKGKIIIGKLEKPKLIEVDLQKLNRFLGFTLPFSLIKKYLSSLRIKIVKRKKEKIYVLPPEDRIDLKIEEDIFEEILRLYGANEPQKIYEPSYHSSYINDNFIFNYRIRNYLKELGFSEVYGYSLISNKDKEIFEPLLENNQKPIELLNPLSENYSYFEFSLIPNLLKAYSVNQRNLKYPKIFRLEKIAYLEKEVKEFYSLAFLLSGEDGFEILKEVKGVINYLFNKLNITQEINFVIKELPIFSIYAQGLLNNHEVLKIGLIKNKILNFYDINSKIAFCEINLNQIKNFSSVYKKFVYWGDYPEIIRDISFYVDKNYDTKEILSSLKKIEIKNLKISYLLDIYFSPNFPNKKSITLRFVFQSPQRTLTEEEVEDEVQKIKETLFKLFRVDFRD